MISRLDKSRFAASVGILAFNSGREALRRWPGFRIQSTYTRLWHQPKGRTPMGEYLQITQQVQTALDQFEYKVKDSWRFGDAKFDPKTIVLPAPWDSMKGI